VSKGAKTAIALCVALAVIAFAAKSFLATGATPNPPADGEYRIATYNLGWLLDESSEARYRSLATVVESLRPDLLAVQEVESREALMRVLPNGYEVAIADDPKEDQELGFAVRSPFRILDYEVLFASRRYDYAFPGRRNVLAVEVATPSGETIHIYVVHYKSRAGGRTESDDARIEASRLLLDHIQKNKRNRFIVLGDFNDTPGDESLNILESGDPLGGRSEQEIGEYLVNLQQPLYEDDFVTQGFFREYRGSVTQPVVRGAAEDNDRLRGTHYTFPAEVKVTEALFDQILVSVSLFPSVAETGIYAGGDALSGKVESIDRNREGDAYVRRKGSLPSDHLPVYADVRFGR
jgi:endonuclease/exonuclease/phosphatase family metal-dependent hydrolase